jgi:iron complex transport system substrate-binding protein
MKKKIYLMVAIVLIVLSILFATLYFASQNKISEKNPLVIIDTAGKEVTFTSYPEKVISLIPAATENIYDLESGDKLIAVDTYSNYPSETENLPKLETNVNLNIESIISLNPDVVFMSKMGQTLEQYANLTNAGIKIVMVDATSIQETYEMIDLIGKVLNKETKAKEIINQMKNEFENLKNEVKDKDAKTLYYEVSPLEYGLWTSGKNTFENEIMNLLNIQNIFSDVEGWVQISEEQVLAKDPEYIVTTTMDYGDFNAVEEIISRENWSNVTAIKSKNVYSINPDIMSRPTKRLIEGAKELKNIVYGE